MELIDKADIISEIERRIKELEPFKTEDNLRAHGAIAGYYQILSFIRSLETKEVDLDNELDFVKDAYYYFTSDERSSMKKVARHFFELGLQMSYKARKNDKSYVKIDRKVLFEICDAILSHDGYYDRNDCPENDSPYFVDDWDSGFRKKVENIRNNS